MNEVTPYVYTPGAVDEVAAALVQAQPEIPPIPRNQSVTVRTDKGTYSYSYADLPSIMGAVIPVLAKHKLAILHRSTPHTGGVRVITTLLHESGQSISSDLVMETKQGTPQAIGSLLSYAKRYNVSLILGLASEEDDDGALAQGLGGRAKSTPRATPKGKKTPPTPEPIEDPDHPAPPPPTGDAPASLTGGQLKTMFTMISNKGYGRAALKDWLAGEGLTVASSKDIPASWANKIFAWIDTLATKEAS